MTGAWVVGLSGLPGVRGCWMPAGQGLVVVMTKDQENKGSRDESQLEGDQGRAVCYVCVCDMVGEPACGCGVWI